VIASELLIERLGRLERSCQPNPCDADGQSAGSPRHVTHRIEQQESAVVCRDLLLEEIIHRTKNTLQLAIALLEEEADSTNDTWSRCILRDVQKQVLTLCRAHDRFYRGMGTGGRSLGLRIMEICSSIRDSFGKRANQIAFEFNVAEIPLYRHQEICLSLILQELITNAFKHAFPGGTQGTIKIDLDVDDLSICRLYIRDDGIGGTLSSPASTGLILIEAFTSILQGKLSVTSDNGTTVEVSFPSCPARAQASSNLATLKPLRSRGRLRRRRPSEESSMQTPWHQVPITTPNVSSQYAQSAITGRGHAMSWKSRRTSLRQDFMRDWRRWSEAEQATALCLAAALMSGIPSLFLTMILG
jgi:two-component sensor histidine kinase